MRAFIEKLLTLPFWARVLGIVLIHFLVNVCSGMIFLFDDFSFANQLTHSLIHLSFFLIAIRLLYMDEKHTLLAKRIGLISLGLFLILNFIPYMQELALHDNGFVPFWAQAPQIQFGWPNVCVRVFTTEFQLLSGDDISNPLIHFNFFFLNLYIVAILISVELKLVSFFQRRKASLA